MSLNILQAVNPKYNAGLIVSPVKLRFYDLTQIFGNRYESTVYTRIADEAPGYNPVAFTMDTYSHIISGIQEHAMALLNDALMLKTDSA